MLLVECDCVVNGYDCAGSRVLGDRHVRIYVSLLHAPVASQSVNEADKEGDVSSSLREAVQTTV